MSFRQKQIIASLLAIFFSLAVFSVVSDLASENSKLERLAKSVRKRLVIFAQVEFPLYFMPRFSDRLNFLASELSITAKEVEYLGQVLNLQISQCDCKNMTSECFDCRPGIVFGDPCPERREIEGKQFDMETNIDKASFLRRFLEKELEISLERELKTLREDDAAALRENLTTLLQQTQDIVSDGREIWNLSHSHNTDLNQCQSQCRSLNPGFTFQACINPGQQKPAILRFVIKVSLTDLDLGAVTIKNINLGLPKEISRLRLPDLAPLTINIPNAQINFPDTPLGEPIFLKPIVFHPPTVKVPDIPTLNFSCPQLPNLPSSYQWPPPESPPQETIEIMEKEFEEFSTKYELLNNICLPLAAFKYEDIVEYLSSPEYTSCHVPETVRPTIIALCAEFKEKYANCLANAQPGEEINCRRPPDSCNAPPPAFNSDLVGIMEWEGEDRSAPAQTIANFPASMLGCPASPPTLPKITFPKITIPDIKLPRFRFMPFFDIKLPSFIFEDLVLPDIKLCNFNDCSDIFPRIEFRSPILDLPQITVPTIPLPDSCITSSRAGTVCLNIPQVEIENLRYPAIPLISYQLLELNKLLTPELELPSIKLPRPKLSFALRGFDIDFLNMILGLVSKVFPIPSGCITVAFKLIPLIIHFDDFIFSWPVFPEIPQIPYCSQINDFCQNLKQKLQKLSDVMDKARDMENIINAVFQSQIQAKLNEVSQKISQEISSSIEKQLQERAQKIKQDIERHVRENVEVKDNLLKIPPLSIAMEPITLPRISLEEKVWLPSTIEIPWPKGFEKIILKEAISYRLPVIPLSRLSYQKEFPFKIPGFQLSSLTAKFGPLRTACEAASPAGGNPYPISQIQAALDRVGQIQNEIQITSQKIFDILR